MKDSMIRRTWQVTHYVRCPVCDGLQNETEVINRSEWISRPVWRTIELKSCLPCWVNHCDALKAAAEKEGK